MASRQPIMHRHDRSSVAQHMDSRTMHRDIELAPVPGPRVQPGRSVIAAIGIDRYAQWPRLANAVNDAVAASRLFLRLGFVQITPPLLDHAATGDAIRRMVIGDLARLSREDSLVVFFAGHGHTHTTQLGDTSVKTGYVIPFDAATSGPRAASTWLRLDTWLSDVARLPPRHILVMLDACHSGIALGPLYRWRDGDAPTLALDALRARRSRRIITSALDDQRAMDGGPVPGHSLFTGCLLECLSTGLIEPGRALVTGMEIAQYVQRRVTSYPQSAQTPDYGAFELDNRGDLVVSLASQASGIPASSSSEPVPGATPRKPRLRQARNVVLAIGLVGVPLLAGVAMRTADRGARPAPQLSAALRSEPPPSAPADAAPPPLQDAGVGPDSSSETYEVDDDVSGTLVVSGNAGWSTRLQSCRSGQVHGFVGVDLDDADDRRAVRVIFDPIKGRQVLVRMPNANDGFALTESNCPGLTMEVRQNGDVYNDIRAVDGKIAFDCDLGGGGRATLDARFRDCH
jgi:hypothetical protein